MKHPFSSALRLWLVLSALAVAAVFLLTYRSIRQSEISTAWVEHAGQTLSALVALEGALGDLIFASGDVAVQQASAVAFDHLEHLAALTLDNERQGQRLKTLRNEIEGVVRTRRGGSSASPTRAEAVVPQSLSRAVRDIRVEELDLLARRVADNSETSTRLTRVLIGVAIGAGLLLVWVFGLVVRGERQSQQVEQVLRRANEDLDAKVSARTAELHQALDREHGLRSEAEASSRLKDEFLMAVSHELRTPLNALLGWADMLRLRILSDDRRERAVQAIYDNAKLQTHLIADLLDTSRILTGKLRIESILVDLGQIVQDAVAMMAPAAEAKGLTLEVSVERDASVFVGDPDRLQQVVWNLVSNAVKFTPHGSVSVRVDRSADGSHVNLVVTDTGIGIGEEFLPHVFDRFRQERSGTTRPHGGLGLGLAIVRQLVELHGGTIRVESKGADLGTVFSVSLPVSPLWKDAARSGLADARVSIGDQREGLPRLDGISVLIVDDDANARELAGTALAHCGARVSSAASAAEAKRLLAGSAYDVLLVDITMPDEDGYTLMRELRTQGLQQPAGALTAQAHEKDRVRALESGFDLHIPKPIEALALAKAVAALAHTPRMAAR